MRTRGGRSSNLDCVWPTASVRRKRGGPSTSISNEQFEDYIEQEEVEVDDEGYPRGPLDKSLLVNYEHHVAKQLWDGLVSNEKYFVVFGMYSELLMIYVDYCRIVVSWRSFHMGGR